jgi:hypothetical protein
VSDFIHHLIRHLMLGTTGTVVSNTRIIDNNFAAPRRKQQRMFTAKTAA